MSAESRLIIASNRLPFSVTRGADGLTLGATSGGLAAALGAVHSEGHHLWIGWPGDCTGLDDRQHADLATKLDANRFVPVHVAGPELQEYYDGVCNGVLWPVFHYLIDRVPVVLPDFRAYRAMNERFADAIAASWRP